MKPNISILNSVSASGLADTSRLVRMLSIDFVDVYAFMQSDLALLWPTSRVPTELPRSAIYEMAYAYGDEIELDRVANEIDQRVSPAKVAAFATYIPEITSPNPESPAAACAVYALKFLLHLAARLNQMGHPISAIEIVGGSTVDGLWRGHVRGGAATYVVNRKDKANSLSRLKQRLTPLTEEAAKQVTFSLLSLNDINAPRSFAATLRENNNAVSRFLRTQLGLAIPEELGDQELNVALVRSLNKAIESPLLQGAACFQQMTLRPETRELRTQSPVGQEMLRLNRLLLEDAYPSDLARMRQTNPVRLALELEPGPLFNVNDKESLLQFSNQIQSIGGDYEKFMGLNLDIPHWCFLAGIDLDWVKKHEGIMHRIAHAHICDHSSGHFCDSETFLFHGSSDLVPWLRFLSELSAPTAQRFIPYSGFLTCELECCQDEGYIIRSISRLKDLVDRYCT